MPDATSSDVKPLDVPQERRFRGFDGLRAVAILLVILWHAALVNQFPTDAMGALQPIVMSGWIGVDLFFALSGFLITSLLLGEERRRELSGLQRGFSIKGFYLRRGLRILPVFVTVFLVQTFFLSGHLASLNGDRIIAASSPFGVWPYATFWGNYFVAWKAIWATGKVVSPGNGYLAYWSLCVEEHFYLFWPLFLTLIRKEKLRISIALGACLAMCVARFFAQLHHWQPHQWIHMLSHFRMDSILWGSLGALLLESIPNLSAAVAARPRRLALGFIGAIILFLIEQGGLTVLPAPSAIGISIGLSLLAVWSTLLLVELAVAPQSWLARCLEFRPLAFIGRLSYAMYLIHFQAIDLGGMLFFAVPRDATATNLISAYVVYVAISVAIAYVLHMLIERPFLKLKDRFR
jgi:peptidoglycan/LPS O-acetylase OafA/YrhL